MIERILTVGGFTLVSRVTGFARDIMLAAILGAGPVADAFFVAFRLPNHFRAIFAEGAFNAAFIPAYARIRTQGGLEAAKLFGDRIFTLLLATQLVLLVLALLFTPQAIDLLAPGFSREPQQFALAVSLTRTSERVSASAVGSVGGELARLLLEEAGVACLSGTSFGEFGEGYIRFSIANSMENLGRALARIEEWVARNRKSP